MRFFDRRIDIGGLAGDRQLVREAPGGPARLRRGEWRAIDVHLLCAQCPQHPARQYSLDENIAVEDQLFTFPGRAKLAEDLALWVVAQERLPGWERTDELHEGQPADQVRAPHSQVEGEGRSP